MPVADPDNDDNRDLTLAPDNDIENQPVDFVDPSNFGVIARTNVSRSMLSNFDFEFIFSRYIGRMVAIRRDPKVLSYLLPLSRNTSDKKAFLPSQCHPTTIPKITQTLYICHTKWSKRSKPASIFIQPTRWPFSRLAVFSCPCVLVVGYLLHDNL